CDDGEDDDGDGRVDCEDPTCGVRAPCCTPACPVTDLGSELGLDLAHGDFATHCLTDHAPSCRIPLHVPTAAFAFTAPERGTHVFDTQGSTLETSLSLYEGTACEAAVLTNEVACAAEFSVNDLHFTETRARLEAGTTLVIAVAPMAEGDVGRYQINAYKL